MTVEHGPATAAAARQKRRWLPASLPVLLASALALSGLVLSGLGASACSLASDGSAAASTESSELASTTSLSRAADGGDLYGGLDGLQGPELKAALFDIVKNQTALGYNRARVVMFELPTLHPGQPLECVYTGRLVQPDGTTTPNGFNTEHSWPQSQGAGSGPAKSDLHHLFPVDERANGMRSSHAFGEVTCLDHEPDAGPACTFSNGGSALGKTAEGQNAFEVRSKMRGDIARAQFYFAVRYNKTIAARVETTLRAWHDEDPVDGDERERNDNIDRAQHNRNPFVDRPDFVGRIADF